MTMQFRLSPTLQRIIALALLVASAAIVIEQTYFQLSAYWQHQQRVAVLSHEVRIYQSLAEGAPGWQAELAQLRAAGVADGLLFGGPNASIASASLQRQIYGIITAAGGTVSRNTIDADAVVGKGQDKIAVTISFTAEVSALVRILHDMDKARPLLRVAHLTIHNPDGEAAITAPLTAPNKLQIDLVITSYRVMS